MNLYSIINEMIKDGSDLNSLAKGHLQFDFNDSVTLKQLKKEALKGKKSFTFVCDVESKHILYNGMETEATTDFVESFTVALMFVESSRRRADNNGSEIEEEYPNTTNYDCFVYCNCPHFFYYYLAADTAKKIIIPQTKLSQLNVKSWTAIDPLQWNSSTKTGSHKALKNPEHVIGVCKHIVNVIYYLLGTSDDNSDEKLRVGSDPDSTLLVDDGSLLSKLDAYNVKLPLYAGNSEQRKKYWADRRFKYSRQDYQNAIAALTSAKKANAEVNKEIKTKEQKLRVLKSRVKNKENDLQKQGVIKIVNGKVSVNIPKDKNANEIKRIRSQINSVYSDRKEINNLQKNINSLKAQSDSVSKLEYEVKRLKKRGEQIRLNNLKNAYHWFDNAENQAVDVRKIPSEDANVNNIDKFIYNLRKDLRWYNYVLSDDILNNQNYSKDEIKVFRDKANQFKSKKVDLLKTWQKIRDDRAEQRVLQADIHKKERENGRKRNDLKKRAKGISNEVTSVSDAISKSKDVIDKQIFEFSKILNDKKELNLKKFDVKKIQDNFDNKIKSIRKSREELLKSVEEADFFKDNDSKSSFVDSINRTTEKKLREYIMQFNVLRSNANIFNDLLNYYSDVKNQVEGAEEKLKTFASRPDVKALVKDAIKKYTQQKNKKSIATSAKTVKTARKVDVKKNLFKNIEKKKVDKKSNTVNNAENKATINKKKKEIFNDLVRIVDNVSNDIGKVAVSNSYDFLNKNDPIEKLSSSLSKKYLENKKDGKTLDISKAIKNNLVYLRNVCESVQKRTGQKIDKVKSFIIDNFEKYFN